MPGDSPTAAGRDAEATSVVERILEELVQAWAGRLVEEAEAQTRGAAPDGRPAGAGDDADASEAGARPLLPDEAVQEGLVQARDGLRVVREGVEQAVRLGAPVLDQALSELGALADEVEAVAFTAALEACARGLHREAGFSLADWLALRMPWADRAFLARVQVVASACDHLQNRPVGEAVTEGRVPVRRAEIVVRALDQVRHVLDPDQYSAYVGILLDAAADVALSDPQLRRATRHLLELVLEEDERDRRELAAHERRGVTVLRRRDGTTRFVVDAPATEAAMIHGLLTSRLAAPQTGPDGERDPRTARQRAFDALVSVIGRGLSCPEGTPQMARTTLFVTMALDDLTGRTVGHGVTLAGEPLSARQVRELACEADLIPAVLGGEGEILDLGRAVRLATRAQVRALYLRDGGCTFPGCSVPAAWTIAHHATWFSRGGATDMDNLALLCQRHHTHVHQRDLTCTIDGTGVTWHVR